MLYEFWIRRTVLKHNLNCILLESVDLNKSRRHIVGLDEVLALRPDGWIFDRKRAKNLNEKKKKKMKLSGPPIQDADIWKFFKTSKK